MPDFREYAVKVPKPGVLEGEATLVQGLFIRDVVKLNPENFRVFSPDETTSNRWGAVFEVTNRCSTAKIIPGDDHIRARWPPDGNVERTSMRRLAGRLSAHGPPRVLLLLRSVHPHCGFDVQPA